MPQFFLAAASADSRVALSTGTDASGHICVTTTAAADATCSVVQFTTAAGADGIYGTNDDIRNFGQ